MNKNPEPVEPPTPNGVGLYELGDSYSNDTATASSVDLSLGRGVPA